MDGSFFIFNKNKVFNFIHPQTLIPIWLVYFVWNAMIEKWTPWMNEPDPGIIRTTEKPSGNLSKYLHITLNYSFIKRHIFSSRYKNFISCNL